MNPSQTSQEDFDVDVNLPGGHKEPFYNIDTHPLSSWSNPQDTHSSWHSLDCPYLQLPHSDTLASGHQLAKSHPGMLGTPYGGNLC